MLWDEDFITVSPWMTHVRQLLEKISESRAPVYLWGEAGVGKTAVARHLHQLRHDFSKPWVVLPCSVLTGDLAISQLFGYCRGAFTDAHEDHHGYLAQAADGTLLIDHLDELSLPLQAILLQVLEERFFTPVGGSHKIAFRAVIIATGHAPLTHLINRGVVRADLAYRINTFSLEIPPLRQRKEDILPLFHYYLRYYSKKYQKKLKDQSKLYPWLLQNNWSGNIWELRNMIERTLFWQEEAELVPKTDEGAWQKSENQYNRSLKVAVKNFKHEYIKKVLESCNNNQTRAAKVLGVQRTYLIRLLNNLVKDDDL